MSPLVSRLLHDPRAFKVAGIAVAGLGLAVLAHVMVARPNSVLNRGLAAYAHYLDKRFASMFMVANVKAVMIAQGLTMYGLVALGIAMDASEIIPFSLLVAALPWATLELKHRKRVLAIEQQTDSFILALANALKSTPSIADAFSSLVPVIAEPLKSEVDLALKQMRLGCTLEDALLLMAQRIHSRIFDTALASVLIGQRVGGNLPKILETSATALRELSRLEGMVRSRTASGRIQMWVISLAPAAFVVFFDRTQPKYFEPLTTTNVGMAILAIAIVLWIVAVIIGRKILAVDV
ncbi:MAG TPA: type II secretion system F family protein [Labilithrix sp.]|nr:type II secretion system F family protein [Labilithrix sp.]